MKTYLIKVTAESNEHLILTALQKFADDQVIEFMETYDGFNEPETLNEDQAQEIIDESEIGPYYSEEDAKKILNL